MNTRRGEGFGEDTWDTFFGQRRKKLRHLVRVKTKSSGTPDDRETNENKRRLTVKKQHLSAGKNENKITKRAEVRENAA